MNILNPVKLVLIKDVFFPANLVSVVFGYLQPDKYKQHMILLLLFWTSCWQSKHSRHPGISATYKNALRLW